MVLLSGKLMLRNVRVMYRLNHHISSSRLMVNWCLVMLNLCLHNLVGNFVLASTFVMTAFMVTINIMKSVIKRVMFLNLMSQTLMVHDL